MVNKLILGFIFVLCLIGNVLAFQNDQGNIINFAPAINYSTINVNNSLYLNGHPDSYFQINGTAYNVSYVPYSGAANNINTGNYNLTSNIIKSNSFYFPNTTRSGANFNYGGIITDYSSVVTGNITSPILHDYTYSSSGQPYYPNLYVGATMIDFSRVDSLYSGNIVMGTKSGGVMTNAYYNILIGNVAGTSITSGQSNVCLGTYACGSLSTGGGNFALGREALYSISGGFNNVAIGSYALQGPENGSFIGDNNIGIGSSAGHASIGAGNLYIGANAGYNNSVGNANIYIGNYAGYRQGSTSNLLILDNRLRASAAEEANSSIIYGQMSSTPSSQILTFNAMIINSPINTPTCNITNEGGIYYNITNHKHWGCNSTAWNALY